EDVPEHTKVAFIDHEVFLDMSGEELTTHSLVKEAVYATLLPLNRRCKIGLLFPDGALVTNELAGISKIPACVLAAYDSIQSGRVRLVPSESRPNRFQELEGTPDWVLEVVSDSSVGKDTRRLLAAYHRAGIPEYWLIDARGDTVVFQILVRKPEGY